MFTNYARRSHELQNAYISAYGKLIAELPATSVSMELCFVVGTNVVHTFAATELHGWGLTPVPLAHTPMEIDCARVCCLERVSIAF